MHRMLEVALAEPIYDPTKMTSKFFRVERSHSIGVTCNIGME